MKKFATFALLMTAAFLGVLAALRLDRYVERNQTPNAPGFSTPLPVSPAQLTPGAPFDFRAAAKKIMPAVVSIDKSEAWRDMWSDRVSLVNTGTGSGVIISTDGHILTNNHVVEGAATITVRLSDGRSFEAKLIGTDPRTDLAVVKVEGTGLVPAELADSSKLEVGSWVMAAGNPLGYANTLSVGVVSSLNRTLQAGRGGTLLVDAIQTDASINSGNSGGPLTNDQGQVVGVNTAIASPTGGSVGIGFAVPINRAKLVVADLIKFGRVKYGYSGFDVVNSPEALRDPRARRYVERQVGHAPPERGLVISQLDPTGPGAKAGLKALDVITKAEGTATSDPADLLKLMLLKKAGESIKLEVWSAGQTRQVTITLTDTPEGV
jgi:S1-C subfamily serine protease